MTSPDHNRILLSETIPARAPWSGVIRKGERFRITDSHGQQAVDTLFYALADPSERYCAQATLRAQGSAYIDAGTKIRSNEGRVMLCVEANTGGAHDTSAGACSCEANTVRFGHHTRHQHSCRDNFIRAAADRGLTKRDLVPNINFFMNVPIEPSGDLAIVDGVSKPGDYVELIAEMDVICLISNCPQINNPCNGFHPTPVKVEIFAADKA